MGYVQFILSKRRKAQAATPSASTPAQPIDLPGLRRRQVWKNAAEGEQKMQYNRLLRDLHDLNKKVNSHKGQEKKVTRDRIKHLKIEMSSLLGKIGTYTPSEEATGFQEAGSGF